jgi:leucyl-tRNA synthetase
LILIVDGSDIKELKYSNYCGGPFGYDAFGLPNENHAKKVGKDPREVTYENIDNFRSQIDRMNTMYEEKIITSDPSYYKWTQWIFTKLYEKGLAYKKFSPVNYCNSCETVIANSQVIEDKCERCGGALFLLRARKIHWIPLLILLFIG